MSEHSNSVEEVIKLLKQERDELKLKIHLASMDAKDDYDRMSEKVDLLTDQYEPVKGAMEESAENVFAALGLAADELKHGFHRVRKALTEDQ